MFFFPSSNKRQKYFYFFPRNTQVSICSPLYDLPLFIIFFYLSALNVITYIVRRFAENPGSFFKGYQI